MNELIELVFNTIVKVIVPLAIGGYILNKVFTIISESLTEEQDYMLEGLKLSGAYDLAQRLLETTPGNMVQGSVRGLNVQVTIFFLKDVVGDVLEPTFTWSEPPSEGINHPVSDPLGEFEVRPRYTEGRLRFEEGVPRREMQRVRDAVIRALILIREEEVSDHQTRGESKTSDLTPTPVSSEGE